MKEWQIKNISEMTNVSIRMLRHYDKIGLLKPSYRAANGYRCYTEKDLSVLQQIIALKYFGFSLSSIKGLMQKHDNVYAHLQAQKKVIQEQSSHLHEVNQALTDVLNRLSPLDIPDSSDSITLISRYHMTKNIRETLKKGWAGKTLNEEQFEQYLLIHERFPEEFLKREEIIKKINNQELGSPEGPEAKDVMIFLIDLAQKLKKNFSEDIKFNSSLLKDMQSGKLTELETNPEATLWLSKATLSYWLNQWNVVYEHILEKLTSDPTGEEGKKVAQEWSQLITNILDAGPKSFLLGIMFWNDLAKQHHNLKDKTKMPSPQEMMKDVHVKLLFNPEACQWLTQALLKYSD